MSASKMGDETTDRRAEDDHRRRPSADHAQIGTSEKAPVLMGILRGVGGVEGDIQSI
jgi:hypothetical protein